MLVKSQLLYMTLHNLPVSNTDKPKSILELKEASTGGNFDSEMMRSDHKAKVFSMIPFLLESYVTSKSFVLRMQLYPDA